MHTQFLLIRADVVLEPVVADALTFESSNRSSLFSCRIVVQLHIEANAGIALLLHLDVSSHGFTCLEVGNLRLLDVVPNEVLTIGAKFHLTEHLVGRCSSSNLVVEGELRQLACIVLHEIPLISFERSLVLDDLSEIFDLSRVCVSRIFVVAAGELEFVLIGEVRDDSVLLRDVYREVAERSNIFRTVNESYTNGCRLTYVYEGFASIVLRLDDTGLAVERECFERLVVSIRLHETIFVVETILREAAHSFSGVLIHSDGRTVLLNAVGADHLSDGQGITLVVDIPTTGFVTLVYTSHLFLLEIEDFELAELVRVDSIVSRSDDAGRSTGSLVLKSSGGYHLVSIDVLRYALDVEDELKETVFNRSLLHLDDSSAVRTAVSAIDGKVSEVGCSRVELCACGVDVINRLSVTAGEHGNTTCLRRSLPIFNNTVHNLVHIPLVVRELVAFDGFDTTIVAIGDEFEADEEVVFEEVQAFVDRNDLFFDGINLILDHLFNLCLCGTISKFRLHVIEIALNLIKCSFELNELRLVLADSGLIVSSSLLVVSNTLFEHSHLLQSYDLLCAEEVLRFNSMKASFEGVDHSFLRIDTIAKRLISSNEFADLRVELSLERSYATLSSLNLAGDVSNLGVEFSLVNLAVDERLQRSLSLFETFNLSVESSTLCQCILKLLSLSLNR